MGSDDDIAAQLPDPPPPAPLRRQAAIEEAMRRFDAAHGGQPTAGPRPQPTVRDPWWARIGRPQAAALVTAGLVILFGVPAAWLSVTQPSAPFSQSKLASADSADMREAALDAPSATARSDVSTDAAAVPASPVEPAQPAAASGQLLASEEAKDSEARALPQAVAASAPPIDMARAERAPAAPIVQAKQGESSGRDQLARLADAAPRPASAPMAAPPPPPIMVASAAVGETSASNLAATTARQASRTGEGRAMAGGIVAGRSGAAKAKKSDDLVVPSTRPTYLTTPLAIASGDWNACTIDDPGRSLRNCRRLINPGAAGPNGQAAAHVADGLSRAWQGDLDGAIANFDRAIAISPRNAIAYLNRGLALQRKGEFIRASADLDRAVRYAPQAARGYYNRSLLLRQRGEADRAEADADRAVALDPDYVAVVK